MSIGGRLVAQTELNSNGDAFHEMFAHNPYHFTKAFPDIIQSMVLLKGSWGTSGSVVLDNYTLERKKNVVKAVVEGVDDDKRLVTYKVIEGNLLQLYKTISMTLQVDTHGDKNSVTWTVEYVKQNPILPDPNSLVNMLEMLTKGVETLK